MQTNFTSIKSVLYDLSLTLPEQYWNESHMLEWAYKALHKMNYEHKLEETVAIVPILEHKAMLPSDLKYIVSIVAKHPFNLQDEEWLRKILNLEPTEHTINGGIPKYAVIPIYQYGVTNWRPIRLSTNAFASVMHLDSPTPYFNSKTWANCSYCTDEYTVDPTGCITTSFPSGCVMIAYLRYPKDKDGDLLIPDEEDLKEAIMHYCLYRYWLAKSTIKEEGAEQRRDFHLSMFETLKMKAIQGPTIAQLENMMNMRNRLVPKTNMFEGNFGAMNHREQESNIYNSLRYN